MALAIGPIATFFASGSFSLASLFNCSVIVCAHNRSCAQFSCSGAHAAADKSWTRTRAYFTKFTREAEVGGLWRLGALGHLLRCLLGLLGLALGGLLLLEGLLLRIFLGFLGLALGGRLCLLLIRGFEARLRQPVSRSATATRRWHHRKRR
jgi:hypothetical protein